MTDFDKLWEFTDQIPGSFTRLSGEKLYEYAMKAPNDGWIVEVGVDQGRSASLLLHASSGRNIGVRLIDSWESVLIDNFGKVQRMRDCFPQATADIWRMTSVAAAGLFNGEIDLIHIDANHYEPNPANDCEAWLPKVKSGGIAAFHDYDSTFVAVKEAVDKYTEGWEDLGNWDSLAIRRKP